MRRDYDPSPVCKTHYVTRTEISKLPLSEIETRLVAFSLREIDRAKQRINKIPELNPVEARSLYWRLLEAFAIEHDAPELESSFARRAA